MMVISCLLFRSTAAEIEANPLVEWNQFGHYEYSFLVQDREAKLLWMKNAVIFTWELQVGKECEVSWDWEQLIACVKGQWEWCLWKTPCKVGRIRHWWAVADFSLAVSSSQNVVMICTDLCSGVFCKMSTVWIVDKFYKYFVCELSVWWQLPERQF